MPTLVLTFQDTVIREYAFLKTGMSIGRSMENAIVIDNLAVSSHHATIEVVGSDYILTDLDSTNGTFVNDKRISSHALANGDRITIGKHEIRFVLPSPVQDAEPIAAARPATMLLDTEQYRELLAKQDDADQATHGNRTPPRAPAARTSPARLLTILVLGAIAVGLVALV